MSCAYLRMSGMPFNKNTYRTVYKKGINMNNPTVLFCMKLSCLILYTYSHTDLSLENSVMTLLRFNHRAKKPNMPKSMSHSSTHSLQTVMNRSTNNHLICLSPFWKFWYHYFCVCVSRHGRHQIRLVCSDTRLRKPT